jgi:hypothetical protein
VLGNTETVSRRSKPADEHGPIEKHGTKSDSFARSNIQGSLFILAGMRGSF